MKALIVFISLLLGSLNASKCQTHSQLNSELLDLYNASELPGFAVAIVNADGIRYINSFGYENPSSKKEFTVDQRFNIASISKTFIGVSLMKLIDNKEIEITTPINDILPFNVKNTAYPDIDITVEHLAHHTSGLNDDDIESKSWYLQKEQMLTKKLMSKGSYKDFNSWKENNASELGFFLEDIFNKNGKNYSKRRFGKMKPGEAYNYSNIGAALAAYIVELKSGVKYEDYVKKLLFEEFNIKDEIWKQNVSLLPTTYFQNKTKIPQYKPILYPTGGMMLSCKELSQYLIEIIKGYDGKSKMLEKESFKTMLSLKEGGPGKYAIFWEIGDDTIGHNGGNYGVTCLMNFNPATGIGKVFMTNISSYESNKLLNQMIAIWDNLTKVESGF